MKAIGNKLGYPPDWYYNWIKHVSDVEWWVSKDISVKVWGIGGHTAEIRVSINLVLRNETNR